MEETLKVYGSKEDLAALESELKKAGIERFFDNFVRASSKPSSPSISYVIVSEISSCIKFFLSTRRKRMVTRETHGERTTISGDLSVEEIERLLKIPHAFNIEDIEPEPAAEPSNKESEMGFHVGIKENEEKRPKK
jgi:hypothetical protein